MRHTVRRHYTRVVTALVKRWLSLGYSVYQTLDIFHVCHVGFGARLWLLLVVHECLALATPWLLLRYAVLL